MLAPAMHKVDTGCHVLSLDGPALAVLALSAFINREHKQTST